MQPLVSVIIPVFNVKPYLGECLDSVINQTYKNLEIILIDDGSEDGSGELCDLFQNKDSRVTVIHQSNAGISSARNIGLDLFRGDIIAFLDSDDALLSDMIETMVNSITQDDVDISICGYYMCKTEHKLTPHKCDKVYVEHRDILSSKDALHKMINLKINSFVWNKVYRRTIFENLRFPKGLNYEDIVVMPCILEKAKRISIIDKPLIIHRKRQNSISSTSNVSNIYDWIRANKYKERFIINRTPTIFNEECLDKWRANFMSNLIAQRCALQSDKSVEAQSLCATIMNEIRKYKEKIDRKNMKAFIKYYSYLISPHLYMLLLHSNQYIKTSLRNNNLFHRFMHNQIDKQQVDA